MPERTRTERRDGGLRFKRSISDHVSSDVTPIAARPRPRRLSRPIYPTRPRAAPWVDWPRVRRRPPPLVLASASPRRRELLAGLGLSFESTCPTSTRRRWPARRPEAMVLRLARAKARAVAERRAPRRGRTGRGGHGRPLVIAADTTVVLDGECSASRATSRRPPPSSPAWRAATTGSTPGHALRLGDARGERPAQHARALPAARRAEVADYAATGEGLDKAGGYAIQGLGATLIDGIDGCYGAVVGLSLPRCCWPHASWGCGLSSFVRAWYVFVGLALLTFALTAFVGRCPRSCRPRSRCRRRRSTAPACTRA
jgi:septum formation protein